jgi:hypothetical protein
VDDSDIRTADGCEEVRFAIEAGTLPDRCEQWRQDLDGHAAPQRCVTSAVGLAWMTS